MLLDDELAALSYLRVLCSQIPDLEIVKAFDDPLRLKEALPKLDFNTCILDIQMPGLSGLELAQELKGKQIIFTTAHKEFAAEAFDLDAADYIRKPLQRERFGQAIAKARANLDQPAAPGKRQHIWNTDRGKTPLAFEDMLYITSSGTDPRDKSVHLANGRRVILKNTRFEQVLAQLPPAQFCRINKKEIIALKTVTHFSAGRIHTNLPAGEASDLYLSDVYRGEFEKKMRA